MTRELIIEGQRADLADGTSLTLEYSGNIIGDIGKISLAHSYTAKLPKTARNARILDDPGSPGHESGRTRRFLSARYYRNGIDLLGEAKAHILRSTPDGYEVALVWNTLEALQALSQSKETLNDLPDLPTLTWIGPNGRTPNYTGEGEGGAFFAWYDAGLGPYSYPDVNAATHPCMEVRNLMDRILGGAGVPYELSSSAAEAVGGAVVLAAPGHAPGRLSEAESGSVAGSVSLREATVNGSRTTLLYLEDWRHGWDATSDASGASTVFAAGDNDTHRVLLNLRATGSADLSDCAVRIIGMELDGNAISSQEELLAAYFRRDSSGWYLYLDEELKLSGWPHYAVQLDFGGVVTETFARYDAGLPLFASNRVHADIVIADDNRFPLQGNLPDIGQWDFIGACMAMFGLTPVIRSGVLRMVTTAEMLTKRNAYDWTGKVDMTDRAPQDMSYALDGWARENAITFQEDSVLSFDPAACIMVEDGTLPESRELYTLPFAASMQSTAQHYRISEAGDVEDTDMQPRIFRTAVGIKGMQLYFAEDLYGEGLVSSRYSALQEAVRRPVRLTEHIRLNELDLAGLDLTRPVYLGQRGQYYAILKIQTSDTDLCKVELLQLP